MEPYAGDELFSALNEYPAQASVTFDSRHRTDCLSTFISCTGQFVAACEPLPTKGRIRTNGTVIVRHPAQSLRTLTADTKEPQFSKTLRLFPLSAHSLAPAAAASGTAGLSLR